MKRFNNIFFFLSVCCLVSIGSLQSQTATVPLDANCGANFSFDITVLSPAFNGATTIEVQDGNYMATAPAYAAGTASGSALAGLEPGSYFVIATNGIAVDTVAVTVTQGDCRSDEITRGDFRLDDPCSCATPPLTNGGEDGTFDETVTIYAPGGTTAAQVGIILTTLEDTTMPISTPPTVAAGPGPGGLNANAADVDTFSFTFVHTEFGSGVGGYSATFTYLGLMIPNLGITNICDFPEVQQVITQVCEADTAHLDFADLLEEVHGYKISTAPMGVSGSLTVAVNADSVTNQGGTLTNPAVPGSGMCVGVPFTLDLTIISGAADISCPDLNIALGDDCTVTPTADMLLNANSCGVAGVSIVIKDAKGNVVTNNKITSVGTYTYETTLPDGSAGCWANLTVESKSNGGQSKGSTKDICCIDFEDDKFDIAKQFPDLTTLVDVCGVPVPTGGGVSTSIERLGSNAEQCDTIVYVRTALTKAGALVRKDTVRVVPIDLMNDVCKPQGEVSLDCRILDYVPDAYDENPYAPSALAAGYRAFRNRGSNTFSDSPTGWVDTLFSPYLKKPITVEFDTLIRCAVKQKFPIHPDSTELVLVESKDGDDIWTVVPKVDYYCVKVDTLVRATGSLSCTGWTTPTISQTAAATDQVSIGTLTSRQSVDICVLRTKARKDALMKYLPFPKGNTCNINTKCVDMVLDGQCGLPMVMRSWSIINWCDKAVMDSAQWIIFTDEQGPELDLDANVSGDQKTAVRSVNIEPWTCAASISLTAPKVAGCSDSEWQWSTTEGSVRFTGRNATVSGLWASNSPVTVTATVFKCNGTEDAVSWTVNVADKTKPVMIAQDQVNVSIVADGSGGVAKVDVEAIDAGSHDAGCGELTKCLLLKEEYDSPVGLSFTQYSFVKPSSVKLANLTWSGSYTFFGYQPLQCGDPDRVVYTYSVDKLGNITHTGELYYNVCEDKVRFCCDDLGENAVALVGRDAAGNVSHSWATVNVEDKSGGGWTPRSYTFECTDLDAAVPANNRPSFGGVVCNAFNVVELDRVWDETCGSGSVRITWGALDADGVQISSTNIFYSIRGGESFDPKSIRWPVHYTGERRVPAINLECLDTDNDGDNDDLYVGTARINFPEALECEGEVNVVPVWCEESCSLVAYSFEDQPLSASDACQKLIRRHTIIDWCIYTPNGGNTDDENDSKEDNFELVADWTNGTKCADCDFSSGELLTEYYRFTDGKYDVDGYYTFDQVIKTVDNDNPVVEVVEKYEVSLTNGADSKDDDTSCTGSDVITATASDFCMGSEADPATLSWFITVRSSGSTTILNSKSVTGAEATMGTLEGGESSVHIITWTVKDACGNTAVKQTEVTFADTKPPTPVCIESISSALMTGSGEVAIWAEDFDRGSFDNCGEVEAMFAVDTSGNPWTPVTGVTREQAIAAGFNFETSFTVGCDDIANGISAPIETALWIFDEQGLADWCYVTFRVEDNVGACPDVDAGAAAISGEVRTELGDMIESAQVSLNKSNAEMTSVQGKYAFDSNPVYASYSITSKKDDDYLNGVTTLDLVLIQKHVLGIEALDSPYKVIAADINSDARISAIDLVELRKLILGVYNELPTNDSWRFVDATETFANANNPFPFTEALNIAELNGNALNQDFLGVKIGDVSGNAIANSLIVAGTRSVGTLNIEIADASVYAGQELSVPVRASNFSDIMAYQFTMDVSGLSFTGVEPGMINVTSDNFGLIDANTITTAWSNTAGVTADDVLFTMNFVATSEGTLSEALSVSSRVTSAAAYTSDASQLDVNVSFNGVEANEFALFQNEPNPFENMTRIGFQLPKAGSATLTVFDVTGKVVTMVRSDYAQGANTITLDKADLNASGVLYYQLESGEFTATKKMVLID